MPLKDEVKSEIRLPTEFQWQLAATGGDSARVYPWSVPADPEWNPQQEPWRATTVESYLGPSTAVGMYPAGASVAGVLDMVGTVWEWCLNAFDDPDNTAFITSHEDRRVVRGGSWYLNRAVARSGDRYRDVPYSRGYSIGFRVVCSSPSSGTDP